MTGTLGGRSLSALAAAALLGACAMTYTARWPLRGPMIEVVNASGTPLVVWASNGVSLRPLGEVRPGSRLCRPWPWVSDVGFLVAAAPGDESFVEQGTGIRSERFDPWEAEGRRVHAWRWVAGSDSVRVADGACQTPKRK